MEVEKAARRVWRLALDRIAENMVTNKRSGIWGGRVVVSGAMLVRPENGFGYDYYPYVTFRGGADRTCLRDP